MFVLKAGRDGEQKRSLAQGRPVGAIREDASGNPSIEGVVERGSLALCGRVKVLEESPIAASGEGAA